MRFAVSTNLRGTGQGGAGRTEVQPRQRPSWPRKSGGAIWAWRLSAFCLAGFAFLSLFPHWKETGRVPLPSAPPLPALSPAWIEIPDPPGLFRLEAPEFAGGPPIHLARRHQTGGGRQDIWMFGGGSENAPLLNLLIYRPGSEAAAQSAFYVELARRAAETGWAVVRAGQPELLNTRFGAFEVAPLGLARAGASTEDCFGFRFANDEPSLRITGFACGGDPLAAPLTSKTRLACFLDQIDLSESSGDKGLIDFFAAHYTPPSSHCLEPGKDSASSPPARTAPAKKQGPGRQ